VVSTFAGARHLGNADTNSLTPVYGARARYTSHMRGTPAITAPTPASLAKPCADECACRACRWDLHNSQNIRQSLTRYEALCETCCCDGCPCSVNGSGNGGGVTSGGKSTRTMGWKPPEPPEEPSLPNFTKLMHDGRCIMVHNSCAKYRWRYIIEKAWELLEQKVGSGNCLCGQNTDLEKCLKSIINDGQPCVYIFCSPEVGGSAPARTKHNEITLYPGIWNSNDDACDFASELLHEMVHVCSYKGANSSNLIYSSTGNCTENGLATRCQIDCFPDCQGTSPTKWKSAVDYDPTHCCCCG
jgi:hypothetical protein